MCIIIMINPTIYANACLNAISVWAINVLPLLFPFFIFTRLIVNLNSPKANCMDKFFNKVYHTPIGSFSTFFLSILSGYPMGAKLICTMHENNQATRKEAEKMLSFCSVSGPMFMLGTVGLMMLKSYKAGLIILISNIIASLLNGLIYRGEKEKIQNKVSYIPQKKGNVLADSVYNSLISILMVGAYIVLSFLIIEIFKNLKLFDFLTNSICCVFNLKHHHNLVQSVLVGIIEITCGILNLSTINVSLTLKTILASGLIGFGGISVLLQNLNFLTKLNISPKKILLQKFTQCLLCFLSTTLISLLFL